MRLQFTRRDSIGLPSQLQALGERRSRLVSPMPLEPKPVIQSLKALAHHLRVCVCVVDCKAVWPAHPVIVHFQPTVEANEFDEQCLARMLLVFSMEGKQ